MKALVFGLGIAVCGAAQAQQCGAYEDVKKALAQRYGEVSIGYGLQGPDLIEVFVSQAGTWTALIVTPQASGAVQACLVAAGSDWTFVETPWPKEGVDG